MNRVRTKASKICIKSNIEYPKIYIVRKNYRLLYKERREAKLQILDQLNNMKKVLIDN